jgi:hypothetical protein
MKKILLLSVLCLFAISCSNKAKDPKKMSAAERELYIDSLVHVAVGLKGITLRENRKQALEILRKEFPGLKDKWDKVEESINRMELY